MTGTATILRGNALSLPLADASVDLIVTSPPYFGLRSYQDGGQHYAGQIGSEATPAQFVDALLAATAEMVRVLKPSGSLWVNLGDKYSAGHGGSSTEGNGVNINVGHRPEANFRERPDLPNPPASWGKRDATGRAIVPGFRPKTLMGMPWRYALACIGGGPVIDAQFARALVRDVAQGWLTLAEAETLLDEAQELTDPGLGLILRAEVIWAKPNGLPESVTDRVRRSHETWFHLVKQPRYFSAIDEIREEQTGVRNASVGQESKSGNGVRHRSFASQPENWNPLGKLPGSVWTIPTQPLTVPPELGVDHFAAFPMEWPRRIIQGWSPSGVCTGCGEGRRPVVDKQLVNVWHDKPPGESKFAGQEDFHLNNRKRADDKMMRTFGSTEATITGYACACPDTTASTTPAVVLDPFGGTGTVALVAKALGRHGISLDMSADYCRLAGWRTTDEGEYARALQVEKPAKQVDGQLSLLEALG